MPLKLKNKKMIFVIIVRTTETLNTSILNQSYF